jgi:hypothetical protein
VETTDAKFVVMTSSKDVVGSACFAIVVDTMDIEPMVVNLVVRPCLRTLLTLQEAQLLGMIPSSSSALADHDSSFTMTDQSSSTWI